MKFLCSNCKAKYQIADEKVEGRTLRMTCRRCQEEIVIRGEPAAPLPAQPVSRIMAPAPAPSPLGADFQMQLAQPSLHAAAMAPPPVEEWHVAINDVPVGPIRRDDVARKLAQGAIDSESLAWCEGMDDWQPIRVIPQLARLSLPPAMSTGRTPPPPPMMMQQPGMMQPGMMQPGMMQPGAPRAAAPGYAPEWSGAPAPQDRSSQVISPSLLEVSGVQQRSLPSWPVMFALAGGFAFLMSGLAIFGANWLRGTPQQVAAPASAGAAGAAAAAPQPQPTLEVPAVDPEAQDPSATDDGSQGEARPSGRPRAPGTGKPAGTGKKLTAEQKAMLARMGGETNTDLSNLGSGNTATSRPRSSGSLTSDDVSKVVLPGRKNLQRCYETALRGSGSDDTVRMDVEMTVTPAGNVTNVRIRGDAPPGMAACMERTVKMWRFPASAEGSPVKFPLLFQPGA